MLLKSIKIKKKNIRDEKREPEPTVKPRTCNTQAYHDYPRAHSPPQRKIFTKKVKKIHDPRPQSFIT